MGREAVCKGKVGRKAWEGKALLETNELVLRGEGGVKLDLGKVESCSAKDGELRVTAGGQSVLLELGAQAEKWAQQISNPKGRVEKLGVKPGLSAALLDVEDAAFHEEVAKALGDFTRGKPKGAVDLLFYGAPERAALDRLPELKKCLRPAGALWVVRPKGSKAISEKDVMAAGKAAGLTDVKVVAFSETHTAEKFVIPVKQR